MGKWLQRAAEIAASEEKERRVIELVPSGEASEIAWRAAEMRRQLPASSGAIPFLTCRAFPWTVEDALAAVEGRRQPVCLSCGDPVTWVRTPRCALCAQAVQIVLNEVREGMAAHG
jgi:hypothetical protein